MKHQVITAEEVKARWAFSEINSDRFGGQYEAHLPADVFKSAKEGEPFDSIGKQHWPTLVNVIKIARNPGFVDNIDTCGAPEYVCAEWQASDLLNSTVLPVFGEIPYYIFLARPPKRDGAGAIDETDPRHMGYTIPYDASYQVPEPAIAIFVNGRHMLIDGYLRSIQWLRNPVRPLRVWVPRL